MTGTAATVCCEPGGGGAVEVGCGLTGDGTSAAPLAAAPAAGEQPWPWTCDVATESMLRCDPDTGQLWTPPEHDGIKDTAPPFVEFPGGIGPLGPTGGPVDLVPGTFTEIFFNPNALGACRLWQANMLWHGIADVAYTADADFVLGFLVSVNGGAQTFIPIAGVRQAAGAGRQLISGTVPRSTGVLAAGDGHSTVAVAAADIQAGQITIASWTTYRWRVAQTRRLPV